MFAQYKDPPSAPGPEHVVSPSRQPETHSPFTQARPAPQAVPHAPQLVGSVLRSRQPSRHRLVPPPQESAHAPWEQTSPSAHFLSQPPQCARSLAVSTHVMPQVVLHGATDASPAGSVPLRQQVNVVAQ